MKARIARSRLLYLRRMETGNNEVLKRILEDSKKHKRKVNGGKPPENIHELGTNRRTRNKSKDSERNQRKDSKSSGGRMERRTGEKELLRDLETIQKINERGGLQRKSRINGVVESENNQPKSWRELLAEKQEGVCGMQWGEGNTRTLHTALP